MKKVAVVIWVVDEDDVNEDHTFILKDSQCSSGVITSEHGHILACFHVIHGRHQRIIFISEH